MPRTHAYKLTLFALLLATTPSLALTTLAPEHDHPAHTDHDHAGHAIDVPQERFFGNLLDGRSSYFKGFFPAPLISAEPTIETQFRLDYAHLENKGPTNTQEDEVEAEFEKNFGLLVLGVGASYASAREGDFHIDGLGPIELAARHPIFQLNTATDPWDTTLVAKLALGIPTRSDLSEDVEVSPELILPTRIGDGFILQPSLGTTTLIGPDSEGATFLTSTLLLGYHLPSSPLPFIERLTPLVEFAGDLALNKEDRGNGSLLTSLGFRAVLPPFHTPFIETTPSLGLGLLLPLDANAKEEFDWGIVASFVLEF